MKELFIQNRENFGDMMDSGSVLVLYNGKPPVMRGNRYYDFSTQRNFYYMTGIDVPNLILTIKKDHAGVVEQTLYLERYDEFTAKWDGAAMTKEKAVELSGITNLAYIDELEAHLQRAFMRERISKMYLDMEHKSFSDANSPELDMAVRMREKFPPIALTDAYPLFGDLRVVKSDAEVALIQKAVDITGEGVYAFFDNVKPNMMEYELEAHWEYIVKKNGTSKSFSTIMAAGANATVLHYHNNDSRIKDGDLVLVDFGAQWSWYCGDISRTFPANGRFSPRQRELYNIVLEANKKILDMIKPGVRFGDLNEAVIDHYFQELGKIGLLTSRDEVYKYYYHGVSHMLGLEVHDINKGSVLNRNDVILEAGMVLTVEPGLYISDEAIGIRIEDNVVVTKDGCDVLSKGIIKEADDIEKYMAGR
ncbi:MAG: aminopeptidase P family protein [Defluviitaleaceae bacterium]|nr:aminopeptidase P family protein [Defluviitaleaceae bacterium]